MRFLHQSISTLPNEQEILSMNVAEPYDALDDSDSNHSSNMGKMQRLMIHSMLPLIKVLFLCMTLAELFS